MSVQWHFMPHFLCPILTQCRLFPDQGPRLAVCTGCRNVIHDQFIMQVHPDTEWHEACLRCTHCGKKLTGNTTCFVRNGQLYCKADYERWVGRKTMRGEWGERLWEVSGEKNYERWVGRKTMRGEWGERLWEVSGKKDYERWVGRKTMRGEWGERLWEVSGEKDYERWVGRKTMRGEWGEKLWRLSKG